MLLTTKLDPSSLHSNQVDFNSSSLAMPWDTQVHLLCFLLLSSAGTGRKATHTPGTATLRGCRGSAKETSLLLTTALSSAWLWSVICRTLSNIHLWLFGKKPSCTGQIRVPNVCVCIPLGIPVMGIPDGLQRREGLVCHLFSQITMQRLKGKKL